MKELNDKELSQVSGGTYAGACFQYEVKRGDTLSVLAQRYGTTVRTLCEINDIGNPDILPTGKKILIPYRE